MQASEPCMMSHAGAAGVGATLCFTCALYPLSAVSYPQISCTPDHLLQALPLNPHWPTEAATLT